MSNQAQLRGPKPTQSQVQQRPIINPEHVHEFVDGLFGDIEHAKRVHSLAMATVGVIHATSLIVHSMGRGLASVLGLDPKHATKQIDRLLGNSKLLMRDLFERWVKFVVGEREDIVVAMDWTEFDKDSHATLALYLITSHGRATPLLWRTVAKNTLKNRRNGYEDDLLTQLEACLPSNVNVTILADRGFGDQVRYLKLTELGWDYVIRFRQGVLVEHAGIRQAAEKWLSSTGRARMLKGVNVTADGTEIPAVVVAHAKGMKQMWCLATTRADMNAGDVTTLYSRRFTIEETFRDTKDIHFGMALSATHIHSAERRDRLLMLAAMAYSMLVLLGAAGERAGLDKGLKTNTVKRRTLSLFNQGKFWYSALPNMREERRDLLLGAFEQELHDHQFIRDLFGVL
jgi:hypothetical protein